MEIFKENILFRHFGELYLGLKTGWISPDDVLNYCQNGYIITGNLDRYTELLLALDESMFSFLSLIKKFISDDGDTLIIKNEDEQKDNVFDYVPDEYFRIWRLEFLLKINQLPISNTEKLYEIGSLFDKIGFPSQWHPFLHYMNNESSEKTYQKYCEYMRSEIGELQYISE